MNAIQTPKFKFYCHTWSPSKGHEDKSFSICGETMQDAFGKLTDILKDRDPEMLINVHSYYQVR